MTIVVWLLPTVTPVVGLTTLSDTVNISFASKILSSLVLMSIHLSVVSSGVNVIVTDADTKSAAVALMERIYVKDNTAPKTMFTSSDGAGQTHNYTSLQLSSQGYTNHYHLSFSD